MPRSNGRPENRKPRRWRIKQSKYPFAAVTTWPFAAKDTKGKQARLADLEITPLSRGEKAAA